MQCEKLYNLENKAYFNCVVFVLKKSQIQCDQFLPMRKHHLNENHLLLVSSFYCLVCFILKKNIPQGAA